MKISTLQSMIAINRENIHRLETDICNAHDSINFNVGYIEFQKIVRYDIRRWKKQLAKLVVFQKELKKQLSFEYYLALKAKLMAEINFNRNR